MIIWPLVLLPFLFFGYRFYSISENNIITTIKKHIKYSNMCDENDEPSGFFIGKHYIGYIYKATKQEEGSVMYILCNPKQFEKIKLRNDKIIPITDTLTKLYIRKGNYWNFIYSQRLFNCTQFTPSSNQQIIIEKVKKFYNENKRCVLLITGDSGTGKSSVGLLTAKELKASFCKTFNPTTPGDNFENLYNQVNPTNDNPLTILLDEFDNLIEQFHNKEVKLHNYIPTEVYNKTTYNTLFDDINLNVYDNVIVILTSNLSKEIFINKYELSYIRPGRIDLFFEL